jgi:hypothetical protein
VELDQLGGQGGESVGLPVGVAGLQEDGLPLDVAEVAQALPEGGDRTGAFRLSRCEHPDAWDGGERLRLGGERRHEEGEGKDDEKAARHESLPRSQTCGGILRAMCQRGK